MTNLKEKLRVSRDNVNQWVEDNLFSVIMSKRFEKYNDDKTVLFLFRLFAIKYRIRFPLRGDPLELDNDLRIVLETKIANAAVV